MIIHEPVEELLVQGDRAVLPGPPAPPEPIPVHLMVGPPEHGDMGVLELLQVAGDHVHLLAPVRVQGRARESARPGTGRRAAVPGDALQHLRVAAGKRPESGRFIGRRRDRMPAEGHDGAELVLADRLLHDIRPRQIGVGVARLRMAPVRAPYHGRLADVLGGECGIAALGVGKLCCPVSVYLPEMSQRNWRRAVASGDAFGVTGFARVSWPLVAGSTTRRGMAAKTALSRDFMAK